MSDTQRRNIKLSPSALISSPGAAAARDASKIPQDICYIYIYGCFHAYGTSYFGGLDESCHQNMYQLAQGPYNVHPTHDFMS